MNKTFVYAVLLAGINSSLICGPASGQETSRAARTLHTVIQTGFADTFQLTLGGVFGGTASTSRLETSLGNAISRGDSMFLYVAESLDVHAVRSNWQAGIGYRRTLWQGENQQLTAAIGFQHWKFASVKQGANDWLSHQHLAYRNTKLRVPFLLTADSWKLYASPLPRGSILHTQLWAEHPVWRSGRARIVVRHGPAHTVGFGFYGAEGNRVIRYQSTLGIGVGSTYLEGGYRRQWALQSGIPENNFWHIMLTQSIKLR